MLEFGASYIRDLTVLTYCCDHSGGHGWCGDGARAETTSDGESTHIYIRGSRGEDDLKVTVVGTVLAKVKLEQHDGALFVCHGNEL